MLNVLFCALNISDRLKSVFKYGLVLFFVILLLIEIVLLFRKIFGKPSEANIAGFAYDKENDVYYSVLNAWQRHFGYARIYDVLSPLMGMVMDIEPIKFYHGDKLWLIEFWKGQYGITTGAEVGLYYKDLTKPFYKNLVYKSAGDADLLEMELELDKNGEKLFKRSQKQWWLNGFRLGEYANPKELASKIRIKFNDNEMKEKFIVALSKKGYADEDLWVDIDSVLIHYKKPFSKQLLSKQLFGPFVLKYLSFLTKAFNAATKDLDIDVDRMAYLKCANYRLYKRISRVCRFSKFCDEI